MCLRHGSSPWCSAPLASWSVPEMPLFLTQNGTTSVGLTWCHSGCESACFCCDSLLNFRAGRGSSHARHCICIPSFVLDKSSARPSSLVSTKSTHSDFVCPRRYSHQQPVLPSHVWLIRLAALCHGEETKSSHRTAAISRFALVPRVLAIGVL